MVLIIFGSLTIAFSSIFKRPRNAALMPTILVIVTFLAFLSFRPFLMISFNIDEPPIYERYQLYHFDLGYHLMNVYTYFVELILTEVPQDMMFFFDFWGIYKQGYDYDLFYRRRNYYYPLGSLLVLIVFSIIVLIIGIRYFKIRDISN